MRELYFLFSNLGASISFSCLIFLAKTSTTVLIRSGKKRQPCLIPLLRGKAFSFSLVSMMLAGLPQWLRGKNLPSGDTGEWVRSLGQEDSWRREWQPTAIFLPGESHGQRNLAGYSPSGCKKIRHSERC